MKIIFTTLTLILLSSTSVFACEIEEVKEINGYSSVFRAREAGDYKAAYMIAKCEAENFDHNAMFWLGAMYSDGEYVSKNEVKSAMWYFLAGKNGNETSQTIYYFSTVARSSSFIGKIEKAVEECLDKQYKDCF